MGFSTSLNFTSANEDGQTELDALELKPDDRVLCLTASGARALDLLLGNPGEITALDNNPVQNRLLALKIAAFQALDDDELYEFLGLLPTRNQDKKIKSVLLVLNAEDRRFWESKHKLLKSGVWHCGRWERVLRLGARGNRVVRRGNIDKLMSAKNVEDQAAIWRRNFDDWIWHGSIRLLGQRWVWTKIIGEPGGAHLPNSKVVCGRLTQKFSHASKNFLFRTSDFATLIFKGKHNANGPLPLHMQRKNIPIIRERLDRIQIKTSDLRNLNRKKYGRFDAYSLSDFSSYCDPAQYADCWSGILETSKSGARYCERVFMNPIAHPISAKWTIDTDKPRSAYLTDMDKAIIYDIRVGHLSI